MSLNIHSFVNSAATGLCFAPLPVSVSDLWMATRSVIKTILYFSTEIMSKYDLYKKKLFIFKKKKNNKKKKNKHIYIYIYI